MSPPFRRVLVANRGEIAVRIIRAAHELGMEAIAVYSDADATAGHVRAADAAVRLGPAPAAESYLRADLVVAAAIRMGADAVHPGYGFLAEQAAFAQRVMDSGMAWVGPTPGAIAALGDKLAARRVATGAGVPVVPGTLEPAPVERAHQTRDFVRAAETVGFPLLVKAAAGGGGRGMRRVASAAELPDALVAASREAAAGFGDGSVYLEREIRRARHVEVQLLGDKSGRVVAIGERDCSIQRRHQKLVEEAPAPGLDDAARRGVHGMAIAIGSAAGLENAATCEFLLDTEGQFWFLEVNTRLQVEHPVTELVAGVDIVVEQFRLAAGEGLSLDAMGAAERAASPRGHAIEVRLLAEDPARNFAPVPGRITRWTMPSGPGIRVDTATVAGDVVPPDYDPLIAKLIVHAGSREGARRRLVRALDEIEIGGIQTTVPFFRFVATHPEFAAPGLSTDWVATHWDGVRSRAAALDAAMLAAAAAQLDHDGSLTSSGGDVARGKASPIPGATGANRDSEPAAPRRRWRDVGRGGEDWGG